MIFNRRRSNNKIWVFITLIVLVVVGFFVIDDIGMRVDTKQPIIVTDYDVMYLGKDNIANINMHDDSAINFYKISLSDGKESVDVQKESVDNKKSLSLSIKLPKIDLFFDKNSAFLEITAVDNSFWNFGFGNKAVRKIKIVFDDKKPQVDIVNTSKGIAKGGSALVVFGVEDDNIDKSSVYIQTNFGQKYKPSFFVKDGFYATLMAWPVYENKFFAYIIASDKAGNKTKKLIPIYKKRKSYKNSSIKLKKKFLNTKISSLYTEVMEKKQQAKNDNYIEDENIKPVEKFVYLNESERAYNERIIAKYTSSSSLDVTSDAFNISPFYPLKNAARVGSFGAYREFTRRNKIVSTSYHLGLDLASVRRADIVSNNNAKVVFVGNIGLYGNTVILDHNFGLYSLYSHISRFLVYENDNIYAGKVIARTGKTGLALGDHLHFGVIVQGIEVRPQEWMDQVWIKNNITNIFAEAKKYILE